MDQSIYQCRMASAGRTSARFHRRGDFVLARGLCHAAPAQLPVGALTCRRDHTRTNPEIERPMRHFLRIWGALGLPALLLASLVIASPAMAQTGYDRRGGDYTSFQIRNGDPAVCAARCERDARCRAWSFSYPRTENAQSICWLKNKVPPPVEAKCCVSGVRGAGVIR
jgi:hypothetical protein